MSTTMDRAIELVLKHEGGYTEDHAGPTNFGITVAAIIDMADFDGDELLDFDLNFDGLLDHRDILLMDNEDAVRFYSQLWEKWVFDALVSPISNPAGHPNFMMVKYFDLAVNMGMRQATRVVQRAIRAHEIRLVDDGILGPKTTEEVQLFGFQTNLIPPMRSEAAGFYRFLVGRNPAKYGEYLDGWLRRAYD